MNQKDKWLPIGVFVVVIAITIGIIQLIDVGIDLLRRNLDLDKIPEEKVQNIIQQVESNQNSVRYPDYLFYKEIKKIELVSSTESWVDANGKIFGREYKKFIRSDGNVANAYLFVNVSVDNGKPLKIWDSIYISLSKEINGYQQYPLDGHLLRGKSLPVPAMGTTTVLLYDLSHIPFVSIPYSEEKKPEYKDWLKLLRSATTFQFETFLSSKRSGGRIEEISIGYECEQESPDCKLEVFGSEKNNSE